MKKRYFPILALAISLLVFPACEKITSGSKNIRAIGVLSEILVVTQNDDQWNGEIGDTIRAFFLQPQYGLPQFEPLNNLKHINSNDFGDLYAKHKCILIAQIDSKLEKAVVETSENKMANPQRVIKITAPDRASWCQAFNEKKETFKALYDRVERESMLSVLRASRETKVENRIKEKMGFEMVIPSGFFISRDEPDFMWIRKELEKSSHCLFIYTTPYRDTVQFDVDHLVAVRDRMTRSYVPGPSEGSYMTTEKENTPPVVKYVSDFPMGYTVEMRGKWCLEGDFMGGPFISYTFLDDRTGNLVTVEGYVYYPNHDKRDELLQLQSLIYSIKKPEPQKDHAETSVVQNGTSK